MKTALFGLAWLCFLQPVVQLEGKSLDIPKLNIEKKTAVEANISIVSVCIKWSVSCWTLSPWQSEGNLSLQSTDIPNWNGFLGYNCHPFPSLLLADLSFSLPSSFFRLRQRKMLIYKKKKKIVSKSSSALLTALQHFWELSGKQPRAACITRKHCKLSAVRNRCLTA